MTRNTQQPPTKGRVCAAIGPRHVAQLPIFPTAHPAAPTSPAAASCAASGVLPTWVYLSSTIATALPVDVPKLPTYRVKARITPKGITTILIREGGGGNVESLARGRAKLMQFGFGGQWSPRMKAKARRIAENWLYGKAALAGDVWSQSAIDVASRCYTLATFTLSSDQAHTDQEIRRNLLRPTLQQMGRKYKGLNYMWFAEKQDNGNVHFHLVLDKFIDMKVLRRLWNDAQARHGYIERYRAGREAWHAGGFHYDQADKEGRTRQQQLLAYHEGVRTGWGQPNSTDIRHVKGAGAVISYVVEYCSKGVKGEAGSVHDKLEGHLWGCNRPLAKLSRYEVEMTPELQQLITANVESGALRMVEGERWRHYGGDIARLLAYELPHLFHGFRAHWRAERMKLPSRKSLRKAAREAKPALAVANRKKGGARCPVGQRERGQGGSPGEQH